MAEIIVTLKLIFLQAILLIGSRSICAADEVEKVFRQPPADARPQVYWFWMGGNISSNGITRDLESLKAEGFGGTTMCSLADVCTPWAGIISNSPTPGVIAYQSD